MCLPFMEHRLILGNIFCKALVHGCSQPASLPACCSAEHHSGASELRVTAELLCSLLTSVDKENWLHLLHQPRSLCCGSNKESGRDLAKPLDLGGTSRGMIIHRVCFCSQAALEFVSVPGCCAAVESTARQMGEPWSSWVWPLGLWGGLVLELTWGGESHPGTGRLGSCSTARFLKGDEEQTP